MPRIHAAGGGPTPSRYAETRWPALRSLDEFVLRWPRALELPGLAPASRSRDPEPASGAPARSQRHGAHGPDQSATTHTTRVGDDSALGDDPVEPKWAAGTREERG